MAGTGATCWLHFLPTSLDILQSWELTDLHTMWCNSSPQEAFRQLTPSFQRRWGAVVGDGRAAQTANASSFISPQTAAGSWACSHSHDCILLLFLLTLLLLLLFFLFFTNSSWQWLFKPDSHKTQTIPSSSPNFSVAALVAESGQRACQALLPGGRVKRTCQVGQRWGCVSRARRWSCWVLGYQNLKAADVGPPWLKRRAAINIYCVFLNSFLCCCSYLICS